MIKLKSLHQNPRFWILQILGCLISIVWVLKTYSVALPMIDLKISMDRSTAMLQAQALAKTHSFGPPNLSQAASFDLDQQAQTYVELTQGGSPAFSRVLKEQLYSPYTWKIRHFSEGSLNETLIVFTPDGKLFSFFEKFADDFILPNLSPEEALLLANRDAQESYRFDLSSFHLIETSKEIRPNLRVDHFFVYERTNATFGEDGKYRLKLTVTGNKLSGIQNYVHIPEAFLRHYSEIRSSNDTIALLASVAMGLLYLLGGCGYGIFYLARKNFLLWKEPLMWGGVVAGFQFFEQLNQFPLAWMGYDTALPEGQFVLRIFMMAFFSFVGEWILLTFSFMAAESLSRKAFPEHPQFWKIWRSSHSCKSRYRG